MVRQHIAALAVLEDELEEEPVPGAAVAVCKVAAGVLRYLHRHPVGIACLGEIAQSPCGVIAHGVAVLGPILLLVLSVLYGAAGVDIHIRVISAVHQFLLLQLQQRLLVQQGRCPEIPAVRGLPPCLHGFPGSVTDIQLIQLVDGHSLHLPIIRSPIQSEPGAGENVHIFQRHYKHQFFPGSHARLVGKVLTHTGPVTVIVCHAFRQRDGRTAPVRAVQIPVLQYHLHIAAGSREFGIIGRQLNEVFFRIAVRLRITQQYPAVILLQGQSPFIPRRKAFPKTRPIRGIQHGLTGKHGPEHGALHFHGHRRTGLIDRDAADLQCIALFFVFACVLCLHVTDAGGVRRITSRVRNAGGLNSLFVSIYQRHRRQVGEIRQRRPQSQSLALLHHAGQVLRSGDPQLVGIAQGAEHHGHMRQTAVAVGVLVRNFQRSHFAEAGGGEVGLLRVCQGFHTSAVGILDIQAENEILGAGGVRGLRPAGLADVGAIQAARAHLEQMVHRPVKGLAAAHVRQQRSGEIHMPVIGHIAVHAQAIDLIHFVEPNILTGPRSAAGGTEFDPFNRTDVRQGLEQIGIRGVCLEGLLLAGALHRIAHFGGELAAACHAALFLLLCLPSAVFCLQLTQFCFRLFSVVIPIVLPLDTSASDKDGLYIFTGYFLIYFFKSVVFLQVKNNDCPLKLCFLGLLLRGQRLCHIFLPSLLRPLQALLQGLPVREHIMALRDAVGVLVDDAEELHTVSHLSVYPL